ncbi:MAG: 4-(cytidine 5'-diphospho)-2-C-methyl-D-erythritol kinase [Deltaproteobacteria bacterium]|nr:4-(cytidine 5'-diphospho)-2-C-methyl-D-erythritol kinase [Deltaproteobacteria bacterium]
MNIFELKCNRLIKGEHISFVSCAKVNLFLDIVGRREDGYHLIRSLFVPVSLFDVLRVRLLRSGKLKIRCDEKWFDLNINTLVKAYEFFAEKTGYAPALSINLIKKIPPGSGLGGASSNAATMIEIMNGLMKRHTGKGLGTEEIINLAASCGADVPFFIKSRPALVEGIGEKIREVKIRDDLYLIIICPSLPFYTREMYKEYDRLNRLTKRRKGDKHLPPFLGYKYIAGSVYNVFETVLRGSNRRMVMKLKKSLIGYGAESAALTGSGSAVFGLYKSASDACFAFKKLSDDFADCKVFSVRVLKGEI